MYWNNKLTSSTDFIKTNQNFAKSHFNDGDYALTLTFKPSVVQYAFNYKPVLIYYSQSIRHYLNVVNKKFLGRDFKSRGQRLKVVNTFELNGSQGVHCHMILQNPKLARIEHANHIFELKNYWLKTRASGYAEANKIEVTYDAGGWIDYMFKDANKDKTEFIDYENWCISN